MTEKELQQYLKVHFPKEDEACEWKEFKQLKHYFNGHAKEDVISYVSALANMEGGTLIVGVKDSTLEIVGTDTYNYNVEKARLRLVDQCANLPSEGLVVTEYVTEDTGRKVWVIVVPKHPFRLPVYAHGKAWQRIDESLVELTESRKKAILTEVHTVDDWTSAIVNGASIADLDDEALQIARQGFCESYPNKAAVAKKWDTSTFLDKAKLTINGKITRATLLLLGKEEASHYLGGMRQINWRLRVVGEPPAGEPFGIPFILATSRVKERIRNYRIKIYPDTHIIPTEVWKYETRTILEALHNAVAHQDYHRAGRIVVTEESSQLTIENLGDFFEGSPEDYCDGRKTPQTYRNPFLVQAMVNLRMIDTQGYGIHQMYDSQRERCLPMPAYDTSATDRVVLTIPGSVINEAYSIALMERADIDLYTAILLDKVQRKQPLNDAALKHLRKMKLIEGRKPNIYISKLLAKATQQEAKYTQLKAFDNQYYKDLILQALQQHGELSRGDFNQLLLNKLPDALTEEAKTKKVSNLLSHLKREGRVAFETSVGRWRLTSDNAAN